MKGKGNEKKKKERGRERKREKEVEINASFQGGKIILIGNYYYYCYYYPENFTPWTVQHNFALFHNSLYIVCQFMHAFPAQP
jgi:hypothetical protein